MPMEGWVKFFSSRKTAGVSQEKAVAVISQTIEVNGDQVWNVKQNTLKIHKTAPCCSSEVIQCPKASTCQVVLKNVPDAMHLASLFTAAPNMAHIDLWLHATQKSGASSRYQICQTYPEFVLLQDTWITSDGQYGDILWIYYVYF